MIELVTPPASWATKIEPVSKASGFYSSTISLFNSLQTPLRLIIGNQWFSDL